MGEILLRGNTIMKGYLKNPAATAEAFANGWFHTGDLAVRHPDGYIEVKDRSKDIIISGGENISSLEVEEVLYRHPKVMEAAVVARPDEKWGETPCAFVALKAERREPLGGGDRRVVPPAHGAVQSAQDHRLRRVAQDLHRQNPEECPARPYPRTMTKQRSAGRTDHDHKQRALSMFGRLSGRAALVTGASSGLGRHFAAYAGPSRRQGGAGGAAHRQP